MEKNIFREVSLKRLSSPEQLDQIIKVTSPKGWMALVAIGLLLVSAIIWSFVGNIPTKISGKGILLNNAGVYSLTHDTSGQVIDLRFNAGNKVQKGDTIARIHQPELIREINELLGSLHELESNGSNNTSSYHELSDRVEQLRTELDYRSQIVSPIEGHILELSMHPGSIIQPGQTLATLEQYGSTVRLEAVLYVPAELAGEIQSGMEVQISPSIVNKEEYGYMQGRITSVAEYPATTQSMMQTLGNENLVTLLAGQGAPLKVQADLIPDSKTISGYKWSSPAGPPIAIASGTLVQGDIVIARERPIAKVIPFFKK